MSEEREAKMVLWKGKSHNNYSYSKYCGKNGESFIIYLDTEPHYPGIITFKSENIKLMVLDFPIKHSDDCYEVEVRIVTNSVSDCISSWAFNKGEIFIIH